MTEEANAILQELHRLEIDQPQAQATPERVVLLRRLNDAQAITRILATEILSLVFQHTFPALYLDREGRQYNPRGWFSRRFFPLVLGRVCHHWREVAWSTPQLWTALSLHIYVRTKKESFMSLLELYLTNVASLPFSLDLDLPPSKKFENSSKLIMSLLLRPEYSQKIRFLQMSCPPIGWYSSLSSFSGLSRISLDGHTSTDDESSTLVLTDIPSLSNVSLRNVQSNVVLPWLSITILDLDSVGLDMCGKLLSRCLNLVKFRGASLHRAWNNWQEDSVISDPHCRLVYPQLEEFVWTHVTHDGFLRIFNHAQLLTIRTLTWTQAGVVNTENPGDSESFPYIKALFSDLPPTLTSVTFQHLNAWPNTHLFYIFPRINSVQHLTLKYCHKDTIRNFLKVLNWPSSHYLPSLKSLVINYCYGVYSETSNSAYAYLKRHEEDLIQEFLTQRFEKGVHAEFRLELLNVSPDWQESLRHSLRGLVQSGLNLDLYVDGKRIDWTQKDRVMRNGLRNRGMLVWGWPTPGTT